VYLLRLPLERSSSGVVSPLAGSAARSLAWIRMASLSSTVSRFRSLAMVGSPMQMTGFG
jgi:hypothetical protein